MNFYSLKVMGKSHPTFNSIYITLEVPENLIPIFKYKPGQYITIKIKDSKGIMQNICYSICGSMDSDNISICIKKIKGDIVSTHLFDNLTVGDTLPSSIPAGSFVLEKSKAFGRKNITFISAGSEITPIKS